MVELLVQNKALDLYEGEVVSLTMAINDLASIESADGNYSNKFSIPSTSNNNEVLGYPNELNFVTGFKPTKSRDASILIDGLEIQRGFIQVEQYNHKNKEFSVSFMSGNVDWMDAITDKKLKDINLLQYNHVWNTANVVASFSNTDGYIYPFINYGRSRSITTNDQALPSWLPAMYSHTLVRKMFEDVGWKVGGSLFKDAIFKKHIIPFSVKDLDLDKQRLDLLGFSANRATGTYAAATPIVFPIVEDGNTLLSYDNTTGVYTSNVTGTFDVYGSFIYTRGGADRIEIRINGAVYINAATTYVQTQLSLNPTDTVTITTNNGATSALGTEKRNRFVISATNELVEGMTMPMSSTLPDMTQDSFIKTIFNQFGVVFVSDNISKTVYMNKFSDIKNNIPNAIDWTDKLDNGREIEIDYTELVSDYNKVNTYGYKENKDNSLGAWATEVKPFNGNGSFEIDNDFLSKEDEVFESDFVSSDTLLAFNGRTNLMYIPRYFDNGQTDTLSDNDPLPRCAICATDINVPDIFSTGLASINVVGSSSTTNTTTVPYAYFQTRLTGYDDVDSINQCLSFGDNVSPKAHENLLDTYYGDYISILNNPRRITAYFLLNERDINNLDFMNPIYLGGELNNYFYINKVADYRPMEGGVTKVELVLIA